MYHDVPVGDGVQFLSYEGMPSKHYSKGVGHAGKLLRGEVQPTEGMPDLSDSASASENNEPN